MKMFKFLYKVSLVLGVIVMASCSKEDTISSTDDKDINLHIRFDRQKTRSIDSSAPSNMLSNINSAHLMLLKNGKAVLVHEIQKDDLKKLQENDGYTFQRAYSVVDGVFLLINKPDGVILNNNMSVEGMKSRAIQTTILDIQPAAKEGYQNIKNGVMVGASSSFTLIKKKAPADSDGPLRDTYKAEVSVKPSIARLEVSGEVLHDKDLIQDFKLRRIYLDNFIKDNSTENVIKINVGTDPEIDKYYVGLESMFNQNLSEFKKLDNQVYAFHLFPQEVTKPTGEENLKDVSVKLLLKVEYDQYDGKNNLVKEKRVEYPTLRFVVPKQGSDNDLDINSLSIKSGNLYKVDLGKIDWNGDGVFDDKDVFKPGDGGDTPNAKSKDVGIEIVITDWEEVVINPPL